jgi:hypothetical protein
VYRHFFSEKFTSTLGTRVSSSTVTHVVHAWWGTSSCSPHCQTASYPDFQWTVDRTRRRSQLACKISWPQSSGFLVVGTAKDFGAFSADQQLRGIRATSRECLSGDSGSSAYLRVTRSWKLCWDTREPHRTSAVELTWISPAPQQALVSEQTLTGNFWYFKLVLHLLKVWAVDSVVK